MASSAETVARATALTFAALAYACFLLAVYPASFLAAVGAGAMAIVSRD